MKDAASESPTPLLRFGGRRSGGARPPGVCSSICFERFVQDGYTRERGQGASQFRLAGVDPRARPPGIAGVAGGVRNAVLISASHRVMHSAACQLISLLCMVYCN